MDIRTKLQTAVHSLSELVNAPFVIGFAAALTWMGVFYSVVANDTAGGGVLTDSTANDVYLVSLIAGTVVDVAFVITQKAAPFAASRRGCVFFALLMALAALALSLSPLAPAAAPGVLIGGGTVLAGVASTFFLLCWALAFGAMELKTMFPSLILAYVLMNCANVFFALSNTYTAISLSLGLPLLSLACLLAGRKAAPESVSTRYRPGIRNLDDVRTRISDGPVSGPGGNPPDPAPNESFPARLLPKLCAVFFLWALVNRLFRCVYASSTTHEALAAALMNSLSTAVVTVVIAGIIAMMLLCPQKFRFEHAYRPFFLISLAGLTLLPLSLEGADAVWGYALNTSGYHMFCMFMWVIIAACCHNYPEQALRIYGMVGAFWSGGAVCGVALAQTPPAVPSTTAVALLVCGGTMVLTSCYLFVFTERDASLLAQILPIQRRRPFREKCAEVARRHGLSAREREVMELIAQGRDTAAIQERLALSASTVQTHRAHIYRKLGIHGKQELIDAIESEGLENVPSEQHV